MTSYQIPLPEGISFGEWSARVSEALAQYAIPSALNESQWKDWACSLLHVSDLASRPIPTPEGFGDWRSWARRFMDSMR